MGLTINGHQGSDASLRSLQDATDRLAGASNRLASGKRINTAADDPAGLSIATKLATETRSFDALRRGIQDGVSLTQTADGALDGISAATARIRELAVQASNGTLSAEDRSAIQTEIDGLVRDVDRAAPQTEFNGRVLLDGSAGAGSGVNVTTSLDGSGENVEIGDTRAAALGLSGLDVTSAEGAGTAIDAADAAASNIEARRSALGAHQNRFAAAIRQVQVATENTAAARSHIEDADVAREATARIAARIQQDVAIATRAQLNQNQGSVLRLLEP